VGSTIDSRSAELSGDSALLRQFSDASPLKPDNIQQVITGRGYFTVAQELLDIAASYEVIIVPSTRFQTTNCRFASPFRGDTARSFR